MATAGKCILAEPGKEFVNARKYDRIKIMGGDGHECGCGSLTTAELQIWGGVEAMAR
jgi:hypothetical protein